MSVYSPNVACSEEFGTRTENYNDKLGLMSASVTLRLPYANRHLLVADVCGLRRAWPNGAAGVTPLACTAAIVPTQGRPNAQSGQSVDGLEALVTINYSTEITDVLSESLEPSAEFVTLDNKWFRWGSGTGDPVREEEAPGYLMRGLNLVRHLYDVYPPLTTDLVNLVGCVNNAPYVSSLLQMTFDIDTLLFQAPVISRKVDSTNVTKYDIEKKYTYKPNGWNTFFRTKTAAWTQIFLAGAGSSYTPYPQASFVNILP